MSNTKICTHCGKRKNIEHYQVKGNAKDGRRKQCKPCRSELMRNYRATGSTKINEFGDTSLKSLERVLSNLRVAYKKYGYLLVKTRLDKEMKK